ncbi:TPA: Kae1-associated serine/threonine protein kinase [Candidatus Micrarchaeota archaeon]|nr:Kae1-associated serine/threonine protein kinase [Candidatus Micrarchaeota archaeon]
MPKGKIIGKGAEAVLTLVSFKGRTAVAKDRLRKAYRHPLLDGKLRKNRTRREEKVLRRLNELGIQSPQFLDAKGTQIVFSFEKGATAKNVKLTPPILKQIGTQLARMHDAGVAHGDFTTSNVMVEGGRVKIIDFGLSVFSHEVEDLATDLVLFEKTVSPAEFKVFLKAYASEKKNSRAVIARFGEIKQRGRYVER